MRNGMLLIDTPIANDLARWSVQRTCMYIYNISILLLVAITIGGIV
jgi:hypothetical protein